MNVAVTGAGGLIGSRLVAALRERGDEVTIISRDASRGARWDPPAQAAPVDALAGRDAVVHLAGEPVAQRWNTRSKRAIRDSRVVGTANLVAGLRAASPRPQALVCASGVGYYGDRGDEILDESASAGEDFLAEVCVAWEAAAGAASELGVRVCSLRTGVVLERSGGALAKMLPPFRAGVGGPVAGGRQWMPWIHIDDMVGFYLAALDDERRAGALNACAPTPATNAEFSKTLGRVLRRPAIAPVPALALRVLYGEMAAVVVGGQRAVPARAMQLGHEFRHTELEPALRAILA
jgi:uncharacterized protein (TIGR01777 family)